MIGVVLWHDVVANHSVIRCKDNDALLFLAECPDNVRGLTSGDIVRFELSFGRAVELSVLVDGDVLADRGRLHHLPHDPVDVAARSGADVVALNMFRQVTTALNVLDGDRSANCADHDIETSKTGG